MKQHHKQHQWNEEGNQVTETRATSSSSERRPSDRGRTGLVLFLRQVIAELRKVIWPTRDQLVTYFIVVLVFVLFMIAFVSVLDFAFNKLAFAVFG
jgi:preprotein translocase subunit SecE